MKKIIVILISLAISASLAACGAEPAADREKTPPQGMTSVLPGAAPTQSNSAESSSEAEKSPADIAKSMIGCDISELVDVIGEPVSSEYAKSCMGVGDDGELYYDGFTVYTNRTESGEIIQNVE